MVLTPPTAQRTALWAIPVSDLAGVARHVLDVARTGVPGWRLVFLTPPGDLPRELNKVGAAVLALPFGPDHGVRASAATLRHTVRALRPTLVHTHLPYADIVAAGSLGTRRPRLVTTEHGLARDDVVYHHSIGKARAMTAVHAARLRRFDAAIAVSRATAEVMHEKWHPRVGVTVIPNGVDPVHGRTRGPGLRILSLARLSPEKRLPALLEAFSALRQTHPDARLTLAGKGPEEDALRAHVRRLGLRDAVSMPGFVDAVQAMDNHDVVAMLSVWENCSYSLLDAAARGLGVVASDVGGNPEILPAASLVDARDADAIAAALHLQGCDIDARPGLSSWPSVADMCARIAGVYSSVAAR